VAPDLSRAQIRAKKHDYTKGISGKINQARDLAALFAGSELGEIASPDAAGKSANRIPQVHFGKKSEYAAFSACRDFWGHCKICWQEILTRGTRCGFEKRPRKIDPALQSEIPPRRP
jgi:hypothetical protein